MPSSTKSLPSMAGPLVISFTLRFLFSLVDMVFAALISEDDNAAVAAIGLYAPLQFLFIAIWVGLSGGFTAALSQAFGSRDEARVAALKATMRRVLAVLIPALSVLGAGLWVGVPHLGLEPALTEAFRIYATTLMVGMPLAGFWSIYPDSIVKAHQDMRSTMIAGLLSSVVNVLLNALFALVLGWGIFGIAFATVVSRFPALGYAAWRAHRLEAARHATVWEPVPRPWAPPLRSILVLAVPGALTFVLGAVENGLVNKILAGLPNSTDAIATFGVYDRMLMFALMPASATAVAVVPFVALLLPARDIGRIRRDLARTLAIVLALSLSITLLVGWAFAGPVTGFLLDAGPGGRVGGPVGTDALRLLPLGALCAAPFLVLRPALEAANAPAAGIRLSVIRYLLFSVPLVLLGSHLAGRLDGDPLIGALLGLAASGALGSLLAARLVGRTLAGHA